MAIAFTTGTINAANAGAVGLAMAEKIRDDVVAHIAWELVEEYTPASSLVTWYVFKCLAAQSGLPNDFFVVMGRTIGSGELRVALCEGYNSSTHVMSFHGIKYQGGAAQPYDSLGRRSNTYTLTTAVIPVASPNPGYHFWIPSGVSTKWWITVDNDGFSVAFNGASNEFFHVGAYIPLSPIPNDLPLTSYGSQSSGSATHGFVTRNPALASLTAKDSGLNVLGYGAALGYAGPLNYNDKLHLDMRPVAELGITMYQPSGVSDTELVGGIIGKHKRIRAGANSTSPAGFAFGDAYVLQGRLWVPYLPTDNRLWDTGVAV
jgi:hypothetical protein